MVADVSNSIFGTAGIDARYKGARGALSNGRAASPAIVSMDDYQSTELVCSALAPLAMNCSELNKVLVLGAILASCK